MPPNPYSTPHAKQQPVAPHGEKPSVVSRVYRVGLVIGVGLIGLAVWEVLTYAAWSWYWKYQMFGSIPKRMFELFGAPLAAIGPIIGALVARRRFLIGALLGFLAAAAVNILVWIAFGWLL